jgi:heat shock protein HslJ
MRLRLLAVPLLLVLAGCGERAAGAGGPGVPSADPLRGRTFIATAVTEDGRPRELAPDTELSVQFTDDGRLIAQAGCNQMQGEVDTSGGTLSFAEGLSVTEMGCDQARHEQDTFVADVLTATPAWELTGDRFTITAGTTVFDMAPREVVRPDQELVGTTWLLDTLVDGQAASSTTAGAPAVTLVFDGTKVVADTGCNGVTAEYTVAGDVLTFTQGAMTRMMCAPEIMRGETAAVDVLQGEVEYDITADRLTLTHPSGKGLQLRAR